MTALPTVSYSYSRQVVSKDITIYKSTYSITIKITMYYSISKNQRMIYL